MSSVDQKVSRAFVAQVTTHLQKVLRADKGKDPVALVAELEQCITMIKFASAGDKKKKKKLKKKDGEAPKPEVVCT